ncbi:MAG TPA: hypothetical protein VFZ09_25775 [Archangium sp.]|uniref:hypothetical protein n=1 Tax=Archangium sp. TaxID=1872627 RepID=UPI002E33DA04|nr:hypothetical protein [Archangium sp.]HEX5749666.1 hypothetical protein [Archangium sp.]
MKNLFHKSLLASGVALLLTGCGSTTEAEPQPSLEERQQSLAVCAEPEAKEILEVAGHACVHGDFGPFEAVTAAPLGTYPFVDVSVPHIAYNITLPANASVGGWGGAVNFMPEETGEFVFLGSTAPHLRIFNGTTEVPVECAMAVPQTVCSSLRVAAVAALEAGVEYRLEFTTHKAHYAQGTLVIEELAHDAHVQ